MIECPTCEKSHRDEEALERCKARAERRAEREKAQQEDRSRRLRNLLDMPVLPYIREGLKAGRPWEGANSVLAGLRKDYPPPFGWKDPSRKWELNDVMFLDSQELAKTYGMDSIFDVAEARMEKYMLGDFVTARPEWDEALATHRIELLDDPEDPVPDGHRVVLVGVVEGITRKNTKRGKPYVKFRLEGSAGGVDVMVFSQTYKESQDCILPDRVVILFGRVDRRFAMQVVAEEVFDLKEMVV